MQSCWIILFVAGLLSGTYGFLTAVPENAAVIVRTTVVMKCQTNDTSKQIFWRAPDSNNPSNKISSGGRISENWSEILSLNNSLPGQYDLVINTTASSGTQYVCQEGAFGHLNDSYGTAELIVLAYHPNCSINTRVSDANDSLNATHTAVLRCSLRFSGNWPPIMEWRKEGSQDNITTGVSNTISEDTLISILTIPSMEASISVRYICTTRFDKSQKPSSTTAENVPQYSHNWTSTMSFVNAFDLSSPAFLILVVLLFISVSATVTFALSFTACRKKETAEPIEDISIQNQPSEDTEDPIEVASDNLPEVYTTEGSALDGEYIALVQCKSYPEVYTTGGSAPDGEYIALVQCGSSRTTQLAMKE